MQHLDEGAIHAWLDGELPATERAAAEAHVAQCPECAAAVAEARGFIAASSRILTALDAMPGGVLPATQLPAKQFMIPRAWMAVAAVLALGIGTVIATRSRRDVAPLRVAETRQEVKPANAAPMVAPPAEPAPMAVEKPAKQPKKRADKDEPPEEVARASGNVQPSPPMIAQAPAPIADSAPPRALRLSQVIISGAGVASATRSDSAAPQIVSRSSAVDGADTTVTTIYTVRGVLVTLTDRRSRVELERSATNFSDALSAKARASSPAENSISWSDSTGRTRTLRGAMSQAELERIKAQLFGATP